MENKYKGLGTIVLIVFFSVMSFFYARSQVPEHEESPYYEEGYQSGYDTGYDNGYAEGYEAALKKYGIAE